MTLHGGYLKKNNFSKVVFRANGNSQIGLGHLVRCLSLVNMLKKEFDCSIIVNNADDEIKHLINQTCPMKDIKVNSKEEELIVLSRLLSVDDLLVIDGYDFDDQYQLRVKKMVNKLIAIDDLADRKFEADVIINHGDINALPTYQKHSLTKVYTGFDYLIVRPEFLDAVSQKKKITVVDTAFICMGGADPFNISEKVLDACLQSTFLKKIIIVTGSVYKNKSKLQTLISSADKILVEHFENADAEQIVNCIQQSQIAISTASSIALEVCCVKAALLCGTVIDNQNSIHSLLIQNQCCVSVGSWINAEVDDIKEQLEVLNDTMLVQKIVDNQSTCVDGKSNERILQIFRELAA